MATMDIDKEFAAVDFKIKMLIRKRALEAEARIYGMTPLAYAEMLDQQAKEARLARQAQQQAESAAAMRQVGAAYGALVRGLQQAAESFAQGFQEAMGR
ncbi:hypothetical protein PBI_HAMLET_43 [Microbacterium phage Hamlet]|jgi:hypothetical protein|uniref:Uncharacterized protein n=1 Tax=Microbacterium phage Hamlet TaxID=2079583 RepID=A0A2L0HMD9_9CAUD|nr:hypothetical protein FDJ35_gp43 [Microbacterium phage Hamlet]AUX82879.1 hypothetical protein PBI_HAMLET_43 [Microbacterium phage Hamlet]